MCVGIFLKLLRSPTTVPSPLLESSPSQKSVPVIPTPISEEANDDDHETSDQVTTKPRRSTRVRSAPEWYGNPILEVMLLDQGEPTNYEEAMISPDSAKWLEAMKSEMGSMYENKVWTLVCWKYALEAIIKALLYFLVHDNCLYSCYNCVIWKS